MHNILKGHKEYYFVLALAVILLVIVMVIATIALKGTTEPNPSPSPVITLPPLYNPNETQNTNLYIRYNKSGVKKFLNYADNRTSLSQSDATAKAHILQLLPQGQTYGTIYQSKNINIQYIQSLDLFEGDILTTNVQQAKSDAETWLKQQGLSQKGICTLPLEFYLDGSVVNLLIQGNFVFNPLPDGC